MNDMKMNIRNEIRYCKECETTSNEDFKKVVELKKSGLIIYMHNKKKETITSRSSNSRTCDTFILHNTNTYDLKRLSYITELCQYRTKCFHCKILIQRVRNLLDEIKAIRKNETIGVCQYCKQSNTLLKCKRCEYIVNKFLRNKMKEYEERQERFKLWFYKVKLFLQSILEDEAICRHRMYQDANSVAELEKLLQELKLPLSVREPYISTFPTTENLVSTQSLSESKDLLEDLLIKLKSECVPKRYASDESLYVSTSKTATYCICKYFMGKKLEGKGSLDVLENVGIDDKHSSLESVTKKNLESKNMVEESRENKENKKTDENKLSKKIKSPRINEKIDDKKKTKVEKATKQVIENLPQENDIFSMKMMLKDMKEKRKIKLDPVKEKRDKGKQKSPIEPPLKDDFVPVKRVIEEIHEDISESVIECEDGEILHQKEMIKGTSIVPLDPHYNDQASASVKPLLYKVKAHFITPDYIPVTTTISTSTTQEQTEKSKIKYGEDEILDKGIIRYKLSDREFIEKGWTKLPTTKIMRRMNIYKMVPANPQYDWFERHKNKKIMFYDSGEKLAEIDSEGGGKWYYKNGKVALDYYSSLEQNSGHRYVIFSSGEKDDDGISKPVTVLAAFDYLGNGVVYDILGNERLKFNQSEGVIIDEKIGPLSRWKWHSLNKPPVLQPVIVDTYVKSHDACIDDFQSDQKGDRSVTSSKNARESNTDMLTIELDNFLKEKAHKLLQKFKPFQIKMKALKLNKQFSLRILDQANIYLLFRDGKTSLKLNIGMVLINNEIVDTETAEMSQVATRYDRHPPRSQSVAEIQDYIRRAKRMGRSTKSEMLLVSESTS